MLRRRASGSWHAAGVVAGVAGSLALLALVLRGIPAAAVWAHVRGIHLPLLVLAAAAFAASNAARAWRWQMLLGGPGRARLRVVFASLMVGYFLNNLVPARLGELARIVLVERTTGISFGRAAGTVVVERILEALVIVVAVGTLAHWVPLSPTLGTAIRAAATSLAVASVVVVVVALAGHAWLRRVSRPAAGATTQRLRVLAALERFLQGLESLRSLRATAAVGLASLLVWALEVVSVVLTVQAMGIRLSWLGCAFVLSALGISFAVPAAPGGAGAYEAFAMLALRPFGVDGPSAIGFALASHAVYYATTAALGIPALFVKGFSPRELARWRRDEPETRVGPRPLAEKPRERQRSTARAGMV